MKREVLVELGEFHQGMRAHVLVDGHQMLDLMRSSRREACAARCGRPSKWRPLDRPGVRALCEECMTEMVVETLEDEEVIVRRKSHE